MRKNQTVSEDSNSKRNSPNDPANIASSADTVSDAVTSRAARKLARTRDRQHPAEGAPVAITGAVGPASVSVATASATAMDVQADKAPGQLDPQPDPGQQPGVIRRRTPRDKRDLSEVGDLTFHQPIQTIALQPVSNRAITRQGILVWLWIVQRAQNSEPASEYSFPLSELMAYLDTKHYGEVQDVFRSLATTGVEWNEWRGDGETWGVAPLLAQAEVIKSPTHIDLKVQLPRRLEEGIRQRRAFSELNLMVVRRMRTTPAVMLYRLCSYYASNPSRLTNRAAPADWYGKITGKVLPANFQMKVFKRDILLPAIAEVNAVTDIHIELITHRRGRVIESIQFKVHHIDEYREQVATDYNAELTRQLLALGVKVREAATLIRQYSAERIQRNLTYTLTRQAASNGDMKSPAAYFKSAVKNDYAGATANEKTEKESPAEKLARLKDEFHKQRSEAAEKRLAAMRPDDQAAHWLSFVESVRVQGNDVMLKRIETKPDSALVRAEYRNWFVEQEFGPMTDEAFALFLASQVK